MSRGVTGVDRPVATIRLYLYVENNNRHLRGKKRAIDAIVRELLYEIWWEADRGNSFSESEASFEGTDRAW